MTRQLQVGVIGVGMMGEVHARNLALRLCDTRVVALASRGGPRAATLASELDIPVVYPDALQLIADPSVEAVIIASPDETHARFTLSCVEAGKPVLCEKPMALSAAGAIDLLEAETRAGRPLIQVGFMRDYDDAHVAVLEAVRAGRVGTPLMFRSIHVTPDDGAAMLAPDALVTMGLIHDIHSARRLMGREIVDVFVRSIPMDESKPKSCRLLTVSCSFDDGALGLMDLNIEAQYGYGVHVEVVGSLGTVGSLSPSLVSLRTPFEERRDIRPDPTSRFADAYLAEIEAWAGAAAQGGSTGPGAWDGYASLLVADACRRSLASGVPQKVEPMSRFGLHA